MDKEYKTIFAPMMIEAEPFIKVFKADRVSMSLDYPVYRSSLENLLIVVCGVGEHRALKAFEEISEIVKINSVLLTGIAGALKSNFLHGDIVTVNKISSLCFGNKGEPYAAGMQLKPNINETLMHKYKELASKVKVKHEAAHLLTSDRFINGESMKSQIEVSTGADIVDMEAYELCKLVQMHKTAFYCVKVISDLSDEYVDPAISFLFDKSGDIKVAGIVKFLFRRPLKICQLFKFFIICRKFRSSIFTLARFLKEAL